MAPPAATIDIAGPEAGTAAPLKAGVHGSASRLSGPLKYSGSLDGYEQFDVTAVIGREFPKLQLSSILHDDAKVRDLAILSTLS